jgi:hypothetical protein
MEIYEREPDKTYETLTNQNSSGNYLNEACSYANADISATKNLQLLTPCVLFRIIYNEKTNKDLDSNLVTMRQRQNAPRSDNRPFPYVSVLQVDKAGPPIMKGCQLSIQDVAFSYLLPIMATSR